METIATLLGLTASQLTILIIAVIVLVVGWYILRTALKMAMRSFAIGCVGLIAAVVVLYIVFVLGT